MRGKMRLVRKSNKEEGNNMGMNTDTDINTNKRLTDDELRQMLRNQNKKPLTEEENAFVKMRNLDVVGNENVSEDEKEISEEDSKIVDKEVKMESKMESNIDGDSNDSVDNGDIKDDDVDTSDMSQFPCLSNSLRKNEGNENDNDKGEDVLWSFTPTIPIKRDGKLAKFTISLSAYDLATLYEEGKLIIVSSVQRGQKITPSGKLKDIVSQKHIKEMLSNATKGCMFGGTIILNSTSEIKYNSDDQTISGNTPLQIIDGMHRTKMSSLWKKSEKVNKTNFIATKNYEFNVVIEQLSNEKDAKALFAEANSYSLRVNSTRVSYLDVNSTANQIVQNIMKNSDLKNKVETVSTSIRSSSPSLVTFGVLTNAVKANYNPQTKKEHEQTTEYLVKFIDELVNIFPNFMANQDITTRNSLKSEYLTIEPLAWSGYIALSKVLQGQNNWEGKLSKLNSKIEFQGWEGDFLHRENPIFKKIFREKNRIINTSNSIKWVSNVFIKFIAEDKTLDEIVNEDK